MSTFKRKSPPMQSGPAHKRAQFASSAASAFGGFKSSKNMENQSFLTNGIQRKSNNRREWMKECLKLLEAMTEKEESKPFKEPVNCLKYPEFYSSVDEAIDLSKVMLKFRGGQYQDPFQFEKDVRQLFSDYEKFFKTKAPEIHDKCCILNKWFSEEFQKILDKYGDKLKKRTDMSSTCDAVHSPQNNMLSASHLSVELSPKHEVEAPSSYASAADWQQQNKTFHEDSFHSLASPKHLITHYLQHMVPYPTYLHQVHRHSPVMDSPHYNNVLALETCLQAMHRNAISEGGIGAGVDLNTLNPYRGALPPQRSLPLPKEEPELDYLRLPLPDNGKRSRSISPRSRLHVTSESGSSTPGHSRSPIPVSLSPRSVDSSRDEAAAEKKACGASGNAMVGMELDRCSVWFGNVKTKCCKPALVHENGVKMTCMYEGQVYHIKLKPDEMIRCSAYLGHAKHHILFFFVLPNFLQRLCEQIPDLASCMDHRSHQVVIFTPPLSMMQVSRLVHIFHRIQLGSPFGNLFSEITQKTALQLLANIKPDLLQESSPAARYRASLLLGTHSQSSTETEDDLRSSQGDDSDYKMTTDEPPKAYKPKFHFRRQKVVPKQTSASSEPDLGSCRGFGKLTPLWDTSRSRSLQEEKEQGYLDIDSDLELEIEMDSFDDQKCPRSVVLNSSVIEEDMAVDPTEVADVKEGNIKHQNNNLPIGEDNESTVTQPSEPLFCPITKTIAEIPIKNMVCGHWYDERVLIQYLKEQGGNARCPVPTCTSQKPLTLDDLRYDPWQAARMSTGQ